MRIEDADNLRELSIYKLVSRKIGYIAKGSGKLTGSSGLLDLDRV